MFGIAGVLLLLCGAGVFVRYTFLSPVGPCALEVEVVPTITTTDPWREGTPSTVDWGMGPIAVEVEARVLADRLLHIRNRFRWEHTYRDVEFWVTFDPAAQPAVRADANAHDSNGNERPFYGVHGTVKMNSNRLPTEADGPLLMEYWIQGDHGGSPVDGSGTIAVHAADLH